MERGTGDPSRTPADRRHRIGAARERRRQLARQHRHRPVVVPKGSPGVRGAAPQGYPGHTGRPAWPYARGPSRRRTVSRWGARTPAACAAPRSSRWGAPPGRLPGAHWRQRIGQPPSSCCSPARKSSERAISSSVNHARASELRGLRVVVREVVLTRRVAGRYGVRLRPLRDPAAASRCSRTSRPSRSAAASARGRSGAPSRKATAASISYGWDFSRDSTACPAEVGRPEQPGVPHLVAVQQADDGAGGEQFARRVVDDRQEGRRRIAALAGMDRRQRAVRRRHGGQIAAHALHPLSAAAADRVEDAQRVPGVQRLADRAAQIGFERVTVARRPRCGRRRARSRPRRRPAPPRKWYAKRRCSSTRAVSQTKCSARASGECAGGVGGSGDAPCFGHASDRRTESVLGERSRPGRTLRGGILVSCG